MFSSSSRNSAVVIDRLSFSWPDGSSVIADASATFSAGRTGIIGANGTGKSTLLRLIAGRFKPSAGTISVTSPVVYLPQDLLLTPGQTIADLLGITAIRRAIAQVEAGDVSQELFDTIGDDWGIDARAEQTLSLLGYGSLELDRLVSTLSGGEAMQIALAGTALRGQRITALDEPTNNLDRRARESLYEQIRTWKGTLLVVSHDRELLDLMTHTAELGHRSLRVYTGNFSAYVEQRALERQRAEQELRNAEQVLKTEQRQFQETQTKLDRRARSGRARQLSGDLPPILANQRRSNAEALAGKLRKEALGKVADAREMVADREDAIRDHDSIRVEFPDPQIPRGRALLELHSGGRTYTVGAAEKVALIGDNGVGKSWLLRQLRDPEWPDIHGVRAELGTRQVGFLSQLLDNIDDAMTVVENARSVSGDIAEVDVRALLARFLFKGAAGERLATGLSGGERFRLSLAKLLLTQPTNQVLVLDEPTNNLDMDSVDVLVSAVQNYRGGVLVVSHDYDFLSRLGCAQVLELTPNGLALRPDALR